MLALRSKLPEGAHRERKPGSNCQRCVRTLPNCIGDVVRETNSAAARLSCALARLLHRALGLIACAEVRRCHVANPQRRSFVSIVNARVKMLFRSGMQTQLDPDWGICAVDVVTSMG